ncbi:hypothetical protein, partial [Mesorhizobium sp. M1C.F.Ca.ET.204.01.1.1]|uniref:hypothetical protein n=1 Tax=Mesorhizobium sp. M1C.F.Ca.ET.204.01.1.1 TaxID=2563929 RepID=UPI001AEE0AFD
HPVDNVEALEPKAGPFSMGFCLGERRSLFPPGLEGTRTAAASRRGVLIWSTSALNADLRRAAAQGASLAVKPLDVS